MSLSSTLSFASSGLAAASRSAQLVASNIANATTEGYAARSLAQSSGPTGGVRVDGVLRNVSPLILADRRIADAAHRQSQDVGAGLTRIEALFGTPLDATSIAGRLRAFEASLIEAGSRPESPQRLARSVQAAMDLAASFQTVANGLQEIRTRADGEIASHVDQVNTDLARLQRLNRDIAASKVQGIDISPLQDERQVIIDRVARIIPVTEVPRENGTSALFTLGGAVLLDGAASSLGFSSVKVVGPHMTQANGMLSGLSLNGKTIPMDTLTSPMGGGALEAAFRLRDQDTVTAQSLIDGLAQELVERFGAAGLDPSVTAGLPGLFTDAGQPLDPNATVGLASRLTLNAAVDPRSGGMVARLRDGLGATPTEPSGDGTLLWRMQQALEAASLSPSFPPGTGARSFAGFVTETLSTISAMRQVAEQNQSFAGARANALRAAELEQGVDTDSELQNLMRIEQAFAANAKVIQAVDEMLSNLLRI